jgi:hypothetical protein
VICNHIQTFLKKLDRLMVALVFHQDDCCVVIAADSFLFANIASQQITSTGFHTLVHKEKVVP